MTESPQPSPSDALTDSQAVRISWSRSGGGQCTVDDHVPGQPEFVDELVPGRRRSGPSPTRWSSIVGDRRHHGGHGLDDRGHRLVDDQSTDADDPGGGRPAADAREGRDRRLRARRDHHDVALESEAEPDALPGGRGHGDDGPVAIDESGAAPLQPLADLGHHRREVEVELIGVDVVQQHQDRRLLAAPPAG